MDGIALFAVVAVGGLVLRNLWRARASGANDSRGEEEGAGSQADPSPFATGISARSRNALDAAALKGTGHSLVGRNVQFSYRGSDGLTTRRTVLVSSVFRHSGTVYIKGECSLRGAERTFRRDRVIGEIVDVDTSAQVRRVVVRKRARRAPRDG